MEALSGKRQSKRSPQINSAPDSSKSAKKQLIDGASKLISQGKKRKKDRSRNLNFYSR